MSNSKNYQVLHRRSLPNEGRPCLVSRSIQSVEVFSWRHLWRIPKARQRLLDFGSRETRCGWKLPYLKVTQSRIKDGGGFIRVRNIYKKKLLENPLRSWRLSIVMSCWAVGVNTCNESEWLKRQKGGYELLQMKERVIGIKVID